MRMRTEREDSGFSGSCIHDGLEEKVTEFSGGFAESIKTISISGKNVMVKEMKEEEEHGCVVTGAGRQIVRARLHRLESLLQCLRGGCEGSIVGSTLFENIQRKIDRGLRSVSCDDVESPALGEGSVRENENLVLMEFETLESY